MHCKPVPIWNISLLQNSVFLQRVVTDLPGSIINQAITIKVLSLKQALFFSKKECMYSKQYTK